MNIVVVLLMFLGWMTTVRGQGQFYFNNRIGNEVTARFITVLDPANGSSSSVGSPDWKIELYGGPAGAPALTPLEPFTIEFRGAPGTSLAGYVVPATVTVPGVPPGGLAEGMMVLVWSGGPLCNSFRPFSITLGGDTTPPPNLPLGTSPWVVLRAGPGPAPCVPEPAPSLLLALGCLGATILLGRNNRNWRTRRSSGRRESAAVTIGSQWPAATELIRSAAECRFLRALSDLGVRGNCPAPEFLTQRARRTQRMAARHGRSVAAE